MISINSVEIAEELKTLQISERRKIITLGIKDLYINPPIQGTLRTTTLFLNKHNNIKTTIEQQLIQIIIKHICW